MRLQLTLALGLVLLLCGSSTQTPPKSSGTPKKESPKASKQQPPKDPSKYTTIYIAEIINEGANTPAVNLFDSQLYKQFGPNTLTPTGYRQQYTLGQQIRENYKTFFEGVNDPHEIKAFSMRSQRAEQSARAHLIGLLPELHHRDLTTNQTNIIMPAFKGLHDTPDTRHALPRVA